MSVVNMNNSNFLRILFKTRLLHKHCKQNTRILQLVKRSMSADVSASQILKEKEVFHNALPGILESLVKSPNMSQLPEVGSWIKTMLEHNLSGGKHSRGLMTILSYEMLEKPENITQESLQLSRVLGWCVEMLQAHFLVIDDIMDGSTTRRGVPCWYLVPTVGLGAINDSLLIYASIMNAIDVHFGKTSMYADVTRLFNETLLNTSMGQHLDYSMAHQSKDYSLFTIERYNSIIKYKTSYYTFKLPVFLGMLLLKDVDKTMFPEIEEICMDLGRLFQIQDDYIDVYGDENLTGKAGTDIQEGKCSWLAVTALSRCNDAQRTTFTKYYGSKDPSHVECIKRLYEELKVPELYRQQEIAIHDVIVQRVRGLPSETAPTFFFKLVDRIYKRKH